MKKIKIILTIILAFWISIFLKNNVFLANTPKIKPFLAQNFIESLTNFYQNNLAKKEKKEIPANFITNFPQNSSDNEEKKEIINENREDYYPIAKGIYAKETKEKKTILIKQDEIKWKVYQYEVNGKKISIRVPEYQKPPSQKVVEQIFK